MDRHTTLPRNNSRSTRRRDRRRRKNMKENLNIQNDSYLKPEKSPKINKFLQKIPPIEHSGLAKERKWKKLKKSKENYSKIEVNSEISESRDDTESKYSFSELQNVKHVPWMSKQTSEIGSTLIRAHNEIIDFFNYISPTSGTHIVRQKSFERLVQKIKNIYPDCHVKVFGSFTSKLYLPNADIDLVVIKPNKPDKTMINAISRVLMKDKDYKEVRMIKWAKVPLVKIVERATNINFDISFNAFDGLRQINVTHQALETYPEMKYIIFVLKAMLRQKDLHEPNHGGVGSFLLFCLVLTFLRELKKKYIAMNKREDMKDLLLSEMLLRFFEFYGKEFDFTSKCIMMTEGGKIVNKELKDKILTVMSPHDPTRNIGKAASRFKSVLEYLNACLKFIEGYNFYEGESFLKFIVDPRVIKDWKN